LNGTMQNEQNVQVHNERLGNGPDSSGTNLGSNQGPPNHNASMVPGPSGSGKSTEPPFAMVLLPPIKNGRHSRPLPPPTEKSRQTLPPGGARRVTQVAAPVSSTPPVAPPRPEHTLTPNSRPIVSRNPPPIPSTQNVNNFENNNALSSTLQRESNPVLGFHPGPSSGVAGLAPGSSSGSASATVPPSSTGQIPVMELVSLPTLVNNNNNNTVINNNRKVSLTSPRPEPERETNLYTEAPKKLLLPQKSHISVISQNSANQQSSNLQRVLNQSSGDPSVLAALNSSNSVSKVHHQSTLQKQKGGLLDNTTDISSQNFTSSSGLTDSSIVTDQILEQSSIFCQDCGKCKCEACCRPRKLPQKWLCGGTCLCSKTTVVDTLSCMFCVKGCFYHCTKDELEETEIDSAFSNPCSCQGKHSTARWTAMATLWPFLPCLLMYPVLEACAKMTEVIYAKCTASGCQCQNNHHSNHQLNKSTADSSSSLVSMSADSQLTSSAERKGQLLSAADHVKELAANVNNPSFNSNKIIDAPPEKRLLITSTSSLSTSLSSSKSEPLVAGSNPSKLLLSNSSKPKLATTSLQSSNPNSTTATQIMRIKGGHFC